MKSFQEFLNESFGNKYKNIDDWKESVIQRGYKIYKPSTLQNGEVNKDSWFIAKDKNGNNVGEFENKNGYIK